MTACSVRTNPQTGAVKVHWRDDDQKRTQRSKSFDDRPSAERWAALVRAVGAKDALKQLSEDDDREHVVTLGEAFDMHLAEIVVKPGTLLEYRRVADRTWLPHLGAIPVHAVTRERIVRWVRLAVDEGRAPKTITNAHGVLSAVMATCVEKDLIRTNPCRGVRMPKGEKSEKVWLSEQEGADLIRAMPEYWQPFVVLIAASGMRLGEASALQWRDVDWQRGTVRISRGWHKVGGRYVLSSPKTSRSVRTIQLPQSGMDALRVVRDRQPDDAREAIIFRGEKPGSTRVHPAWFREAIWHPARKAAGIEAKATPHSLRDSHVAWLISRGTGLAVIQGRLGHESITTTINVYGHLQADVVAASVDAAQDALRMLSST